MSSVSAYPHLCLPYQEKERAPLFGDALSHCLPRRCRFGEAPIPLQTRADNRRRVADFQSRPVIKSRTTQPPWDLIISGLGHWPVIPNTTEQNISYFRRRYCKK